MSRHHTTRAAFIKDVVAEFKKHNPDWKPEHGPRELDNVLRYLLDAGGSPFNDVTDGPFTIKTSIKRATIILADFISI